VIGLDLGTTHAKAIALQQDGIVAASASRGYTMYTPQPGYAQQDPDEVWLGAAGALRDLAGQINIQDIAGLCLSGAMHSCLPVAADGTPLASALTWADQRASALVQGLRRQIDSHALYQRTGCPLQPIYHVAKLRWWVDRAPDITRHTAIFTTLKDYVLYQLTGRWLGDISVYSATGLLDIHQYKWDQEALELAGVTSGKLPPLASPMALAGHLKPAGFQATGLPAELPILLGASDGGLANLGTGVSHPGQSVITVGTSGAVRRIVDRPYLDIHNASTSYSKLQERTWCYLLTEGRWFAGGAINNGGLAVQWVREKFYHEFSEADGYQRMFTDAVDIAPGSAGVTLLPYFAGERSPYWNAEARAAITGLGLEHDRRHIARAVLEGVAYRLGEIWEALGASGNQEPVRLTGGILQSPAWAQIVCDVIGAPLAAVETGDASAIGAAMLGFTALGLAPSLETCASRVLPGMSWLPNPVNHDIYRAGLEKFHQLYTALYENK
jgi:gluconokinase